MLVNILQKINKPLSYAEFAKILYYLIQPNYGDIPKRITISPYDELRPILNDQYTLTFIKNLKNELYSIKNIKGILSHLYRYSYVSSISSIACIQLQPLVSINKDKSGKYKFTYETFSTFDIKPKILYINDFKFISEPIEFVEKPCIVDIYSSSLHIKEANILFSPEKCDQYLAFQSMIAPSKKGASCDNEPESRVPVSISRLSSNRQDAENNFNKTSKSIFSKAFWSGYYYYGIENGVYVFDK